ncbi:MAG: ribosome-associated translation inhibitor RaiA [Saprospiraceae bacterium]|nr:ribosome-associated translation inhibitor RaiA [Saprospiraceae bacterium]
MNVTIQSVHFSETQALHDFVTEEVRKLSRYHDKIEGAKVFLKLEKSDTRENKVCEVRLEIPGYDLFVKKQCETFEEATSKVVDELKEQVKELKSRSAKQ